MIDFANALKDDANIVGLEVLPNSVRVVVRDWREELQVFVFTDVLAYQAISPLNEDLDRGLVEVDEELLTKACQVTEEADVEAYRTFSFVSSWTGAKILKIVAKGVDLEPPPNQVPATVRQESLVKEKDDVDTNLQSWKPSRWNPAGANPAW